jgi:cyclophilin family peptidyl-prolyl cis-trans isomerase
MSDRRRRQKENRAARREAERKVEARRELIRRIILAFGAGALVVLVFVATSLFEDDDGDLPTNYAGYRDQPTACDAEQPDPETIMRFDDVEPQADVTEGSEIVATIETSCGPIVIRLDPATSPQTVESFVFLARQGFYDGIVFHRILEDFVVQAGDPDAVGTGGPGYTIEDEPPPGDFEYEPGVVAMANAGANTTGSQFFIVVGDGGRVLAPRFNVLGEVVSGQETLDRIAAIPTAPRPNSKEESLPRQTVYIESVDVEVS